MSNAEHVLDRPYFSDEARPVFDAVAAGARCSVCPIRVPNPVGPSPATKKTRLVIVGEGPGRMEEAIGRCFVGPSGKLLDRVLMEQNIDRREAHVTNVTACRPESEDQIPGMVYACSRRLFRELKQMPASAPIVALGKESAKAILGVKGIVKSRGFVWQTPPKLTKKERLALKRERAKAAAKERLATVYNITLKLRRSEIAGRTVFPTLHPAFILRSEIWAPVLDLDIERVGRYLANGNKLTLEDEKPFIIVSKTRELRKLLKKFRRRDVLVDIETDGPDPLSAKMLCVGLGTPKLTVVCYPWRDKMAAELQRLFDGGAKLVGHNVITFDCIVLERYGISVGILEKASLCDRVEDTLVAHHSFASHLPKSLAHVASVMCDARPWKIIAKGGDGKAEKGQLPHQLSPEELTKYNAADVSLNALAWVRMQNDLADDREVYAISKRLGGLCARMRWRGFAFDMKFAKDLSRQLAARKQNLLWEMRDLIGDSEFKPSRAFDLRQVLFTRLKVPLIYPTKTGLPATSRVVLEQLRHGQDLAGKLSDLVLRWRDAQKTLGTYLSVEVRDDGRVHDNWRIGTVSGRLAGRLLTLPRYTKDKKTGVVDITDQVRACYIAPPGRVLVYWDLSQAEMRVAANLSGDATFIAACKGDVHAGNAAVLFPTEAKEGFFATDEEAKNGRGKPFRDIAKNAGFAVTYLSTAETVYVYLNAHGFPVSLIEARTMLDRLHIAYAGYFKYVDDNVKFVQKNGWLRSPLSGRIRYFGHTPKPTEVANCFDEETEALTQRGWVRGFDLKLGDKLLTKNKETGALSWYALRTLKFYEKYTGSMYEFRSRTFNAVTTAEHRWLVTDRRTESVRTATTQELVDTAHVADLSIHRTGSFAGSSSKIYSDEFVELVGWLLTDGNVRPAKKRSGACITIFQTKLVNVRRIDALFKRLGAAPNRTRHARGAVRWRLVGSSALTQAALRFFPERTLTQSFLETLTGPQLRLLLDTMLLGDGSEDGGRLKFCCRDKTRADIFQTLCMLCGLASTARWRGPMQPKKQYASISNRPMSKGIWLITTLRRDTAQVIRHARRYGKHKKAVDHVRVLPSGIERRVWCPVVRNTFFVVRREGDVYISGNTPVQTTIADLMNVRLLDVEARLPESAFIVAQIHDAAIIEADEGDVDAVKQIVADVYGPPVCLPDRAPFYIPADVKTAVRWSEL